MFLFWFVYIVEIIIAVVLFSMIGLEDGSHKFSDLLENMDYMQIFLLAVVIAPISEEFLFRYYLCSPKWLIYGIPAGITGLGVMALIMGKMDIQWAILMILGGLILSVWIFLKKELAVKLETRFYDLFPYVIYLSAVIFAFVHIYNYNDVMPWYYTPALVMPQFILGLLLAYVRVRNGIVYSIFIHAFNNLLPMIFLLLLPEGASGLG